MTDLRTSAQQALEAMQAALSDDQPYLLPCREAITTLRAALAEPVQEPVAWMDIDSDGNRLSVRQWSDGNRDEVPLYTAPPQRKPLSEEEIEKAYRHIWRNLPDEFDHTTASWIEQGIRYAEQEHGLT